MPESNEYEIYPGETFAMREMLPGEVPPVDQMEQLIADMARRAGVDLTESLAWNASDHVSEAVQLLTRHLCERAGIPPEYLMVT